MNRPLKSGAMSLISAALTNVPLGTANVLAYTMLGTVAMFLLSGPVIVYIYSRKQRRMKSATAPQA